jgi:3-hydroxyacyl-CoA dehydrogenase
MINEVFFVLAEGDARATEIDGAMTLDCNHPVGSLALADLIGLAMCCWQSCTPFTRWSPRVISRPGVNR